MLEACTYLEGGSSFYSYPLYPIPYIIRTIISTHFHLSTFLFKTMAEAIIGFTVFNSYIHSSCLQTKRFSRLVKLLLSFSFHFISLVSLASFKAEKWRFISFIFCSLAPLQTLPSFTGHCRYLKFTIRKNKVIDEILEIENYEICLWIFL